MARKFRLEIPEKKPRRIVSREYKIYKEEERLSSLPRTMYEKACNAANRIVNVEMDKNTGKKIKEAIEFSHLKTTPNGVASLTLLLAFIISLPTLLLIVFDTFGLPGLSFGNGILLLVVSIPLIYYLYMYPLRLKKKYEIELGSDMVTMILYIAMYMRNVPNLERAVNFASENLTGSMAFELRKLFWDLGIRKYITVEDALRDYTKKWSKNRDFVEAIELIITSMRQGGERRLSMLDEAVSIVLEGDRERARHFNQALKFPVAMIHALGVLLPVMGLVLFPIVAIFLEVKSIALFIGYDLILPIILFFIITNVLDIRPSTYSKIDITENPDIPAEGKFKIKNKEFPAWPVGVAVCIPISLIGFILFLTEGESSVLSAVLLVGGFALGFAVYYMLLSRKRLAIREKTRAIEDEFAEALFQLGNQIYGGTPIELSLEYSMKRIENLKIKDLFNRALKNMNTMGMTFSQAFFDKQYGAIRYYPSKLIKSVMRTVVETTKKGVKTASVAMLSVSRYLKSVHETQEEVRENLSDSANSLKFQAFFLSPFVSGVVVTMAIIIIRILEELSGRLSITETAGLGGIGSFGLDFGSIEITPFQFVVIIGIYLIETAFILSYFINGIESGEDPIGRKDITAYALIIGYVVFSISLFITLAIFGPLIMVAVV